MSYLVTHPDNLDWLRQYLANAPDGEIVRLDSPPSLWGVEINTNPHMQRDTPAGKYRVHATGRVLAKADFTLQEGRFIEYGPEDIPYLLARGVMTELREPLFYEVEDPNLFFVDYNFRMNAKSGFIMKNFC